MSAASLVMKPTSSVLHLGVGTAPFCGQQGAGWDFYQVATSDWFVLDTPSLPLCRKCDRILAGLNSLAAGARAEAR